MHDSMEESADVCAKRKLEFHSLPYISKSFYVDVKSKSVRQRVEGYIRSLGGSIETFLSNDIQVFVSDSRPVTKRPSRLRGETTLQNGDLSSTSSRNNQALPLSRGKALLLKARKTTSENLVSEVNNVSSIQDKATEMGIRIELVHSFIKRCKELGATSKHVTRQESVCDMVPIKWEDKCFLKVEDDSGQYKPLHKRLENLPVLYTENGGGSPFDGPVVLTRTTTESIVRREKKVSRFSQTKGGYCEMCQAWYKDTLKQHAKSSGHQKFVRNKENFSELDRIVKKLPDLNKFLFKYIPTRCTDRIPCYKSESTPVTSPDILVQPSRKDVFEFKETLETDINDSDTANVVYGESNRATVVDLCQGTKPLTNDNVTTPAVDVPSVPTATSTAVCDNDDFTSVPVFDLANCDLLSGLLHHQNEDAKMFSEASDVDSQTNVLKNLIDSLSLQNEAVLPQSSVPSPMVVNTPDTLTPDLILPGSIPACESNDNTKTIPPPDVHVETPMSTGSPCPVNMATETAQTPGQLKLKFTLGVEPSSNPKIAKTKRKRKEKNKCVYLSQKTSDTKLKLCKVFVTPVAQKSNLKMFWKVRKTGECRLLFSSEKRKRSVPDESALGVGEEMMSPLRGNDETPKPKRQRLVF